MTGSRQGGRWWFLAGVALLAAILILWHPLPAAAHSVLLETSPPAAGKVAAAPASVTLTFNDMPRGRYSNVHVVGPDGMRRDSGPVHVVNDTVREDLGGSRPAGTYQVDWRVISADGHPVSGQFSFTATAGSTPLAARPASNAGAASTVAGRSSAAGAVVVVGVGVALAGAVGVFAFRSRRR